MRLHQFTHHSARRADTPTLNSARIKRVADPLELQAPLEFVPGQGDVQEGTDQEEDVERVAEGVGGVRVVRQLDVDVVGHQEGPQVRPPPHRVVEEADERASDTAADATPKAPTWLT